MNTPIRRISLVVMAMFLTLMIAMTWIQFVQAGSLNADTRNVRNTYREYGRDRGPIVVAGESVAFSTAVDTPYGFQRTYANGPLYAPLTGFSSVVFGTTGIEKYGNSVLNGTSDSLWRQRLADLVTGRQPQGGAVELTIDPKVQQAAYAALEGKEGAVVALDPRTGAVLAMVSTPSFDPNLLAGHDTAAVNAAWQALLADPADPMANRAIAGDTYAPGSTFKLIDLAAILSTGQFTPETRVAAPNEFTLPGTSTQIRNPGGATCDDGETATLLRALEQSCNTPFVSLAYDLGDEAIRNQAQAFGFQTPLSIPMTVTQSKFPAIEDPAELGGAAIGQQSVRVTPMQMAMVAAGIANDGVVMKPYVVATERAADLSVVSETQPEAFSTAMTPEVAETITQMMVSVVDNGTGSRAAISGISVAGKTGTAESGINDGTSASNPHAWFTAFAPADDPQIALAVLVVNGADTSSGDYTGARLAAPIARQVIEAALQ